MRISYIHGPGDAFGTFTQWAMQNRDKSIIKQTYSGQFYDLISEIDGVGQIVCTAPCEPTGDPRFVFDRVQRGSATGMRHFLEEFLYAQRVGQIIIKFQPSVIIISSDFPTYFLDLLPSRPLRIISMHNTFWRPYGHPAGTKQIALNLIRRISLRKSHCAVSVSKECKRQFDKLRSNRIKLSTVQIPRLEERFIDGEQSTPRRLLFVGRVELNKGVTDLISAFSSIVSSAPGITLKIVGNGTALDTCRDLTARLGIDTAVEFTGRLDADGVGQAYAESDLCVCPTRWSFNEGLATVPLEAASYGVPTLMSEAVPAKEQFGSDVLIYEPGDVEDLAQKLAEVITDSETYRRARSDARESFSRTMREVDDWKTGIYACLRQMPDVDLSSRSDGFV